jgi:3-hydroxyisobutyrate dehydrogenase-like beta-hydroxyacid dehydrogenase
MRYKLQNQKRLGRRLACHGLKNSGRPGGSWGTGMESLETIDIAFIGFGEAGQRFCRDFAARPGIGLRTYDILFEDEKRGAGLLSRARALGVGSCASAAEACSAAQVIISAVTADAAEDVASGAAPFLSTGQIFFDVNSAAPETKQRSAAAVSATGAAYVEGAVMGPVLEPGIHVPILAGGPEAARAAILLNKLGMNITPVALEYGKASAIKLCRSIVIKGMEALMVDCAAACQAWGVSSDVYASLNATFPSVDWDALATAMAERVSRHGMRRAAEMRETADMLAALGLDPSLAMAVAEAQRRGATHRDG